MTAKSIAEELMGDEPQTSILTEKEIQEAKAKAKTKLDAAMKKLAFDKIVGEEELRLKREQGKTTGVADMDEQVSIMIDLPDFCGSIRVNSEPFWPGHTYTVPRHVANSLREQMQRAWNHQHILDGKSAAEQYKMTKPQAITPSGIGAFEGKL